jgi:hypothetical protein
MAAMNRQPSIISTTDSSVEPVAVGEFRAVQGVTWSPDGVWLVMLAQSLTTDDPGGGTWAYNLQDGRAWHISASRSVTYEWTGPDELWNIRSNDGVTQTYLTDLSEQRTTEIAKEGPPVLRGPKRRACWLSLPGSRESDRGG